MNFTPTRLWAATRPRILSALDGALAKRLHLLGERYGIADVMTWPWVNALPKLGVSLDRTHLHRWHADIAVRLAVQRGVAFPGLRENDAAA